MHTAARARKQKYIPIYIQEFKSVMNILNSNGPNSEPSGTPDLTVLKLEHTQRKGEKVRGPKALQSRGVWRHASPENF